MSKTLSKSAERELLTAIQDVVDLVNSGKDPVSAAVKVASERQFNRNFVDLLCTGYNTGATNFQRQQSSSALEKFADFPIADPVKVAEAIWPSRVLLPAEEKRGQVDPVYSKPPKSSKPLGPKVASSPVLEKAASVKAEEKPVDAASFYREKRAQERVLEDARFAYVSAQNNLLAKLGEFSDAAMRLSEKDLAKLAYDLKTTYESAGAKLIDYITARHPRVKISAAAPIGYADYSKGVHKLAVDCLEFGKKAIQTKAAYIKAAETYSARMDALLKKSNVMSVVNPLMATAVYDRVLKPPSPQQLAQRLANPEHELELRKIHVQAMLSNLLQNDPIISGYNPDEVMTAYNEFAQLSPSASSQIVLARPWLRKRLTQGSMEPFEAAEMTNVEKSLREMSKPNANPATPSGK